MIGDIVAYRGFTWVIDRQDMTSIPAGTWILLRDDNDGTRISVSAFGGWALIQSPVFTVDLAIKYEGEKAVIVADNGETVRVGYAREMETVAGTIEFNECGTDVKKSNVVLQNLHKFRDA